MRSLALDLGGTFVKSAVLDTDLGSVDHVQRSAFPAFREASHPSRREFDPAVVVDVARAAVERAFAAAPDARRLFVCGQMHGLAVTSPSGALEHGIVSWQDLRTLGSEDGDAASFGALMATLTDEQRWELGNETRPGLPLAVLHWLARRGALAEGATPSSLMDFVVARLMGAPPATTDLTNAAAAGALDLAKGEWHHAALHQLGLGGLKWPAIVPVAAPIGEMALGGHPLVVHAPIGDQQAALIGALLRPGELSLNVATGSQVSRLAATLRRGAFQNRPYVDGRWLETVTHLPAGRSLNALVRLVFTGLPADQVWERVSAAAAGPPSPSGDPQVDLHLFSGSGGSITGLREDNADVGALFRGAFRGMAATYADAAARLDPEGTLEGLVFSGGLVQAIGPLREAILARLSLPSRVAPHVEDTLHGLLCLAMVADGKAADVDAATMALRSS